MRINKLMVFLVVLSLVLVVGAGCSKEADNAQKTSGNTGDQDYVVQLGYYNCDHMVGACIAKDAGIFDELGLKVNVIGNAKVPTAMAAGQMDVGYIGTRGLATAFDKGAPILAVANNHVGGSTYLVASNKIKTARDLVGKKVALGNDAEKNNPKWVQLAKQLGIPAETSAYQNFEMDDKDAYLAMKTGNLDGYFCCDPWASMAVYEKTGHVLGTWTTLPDGSWGTCCVYSMNKNFVKEHPELAKKMLLAHTRAVEYTYLHPVKAARIFAKNYQVPEEVALMTIYMKTVGEGRTLTWKIDPNCFKNYFENAKKMKVEDFMEIGSCDRWLDTTLLDQSGADDFDNFIKTKVDPIFPVGMSYQDWKMKALEIDGK